MDAYKKGTQTAKGWKGKKYYLSDEAVALLVEHCKGKPLTMSYYLDQLIKRELDSPAEQFLREQPVAEVKKVLDEGQRQLAELTSRSPELTAQRAAYEKAGGFDGVVARAEHIPHVVSERVPQRRVRIEDEKPVTSKKDFKIDL